MKEQKTETGPEQKDEEEVRESKNLALSQPISFLHFRSIDLLSQPIPWDY